MATGKDFQCPLCRSTLRPVGVIDFNAPSISRPICPVCKYPNYVPSVPEGSFIPVPYRWDSLQVIKANPNPSVVYEDVVKDKPIFGIQTNPQTASKENEENKLSVYKDFSVAYGLETSARVITEKTGQALGATIKGAVEGVTKGVTSGLGVWSVIAIAVALFLFLRKK